MTTEATPPEPPRRWGRRLLIGLVVLLALGATVALIVLYRAPLVTAPEAPPSRILVRDVRVIDVVAGAALDGRDVLIEGDSIASITPHDDGAPPTGIHVIEGKGLTLVPGFVDAHCHLDALASAPWDLTLPDVDLTLERLLFAGVTRVLDPGSAAPGIFELRGEVAAGERLGPTIHTTGPLFTVPGGHPVPMFRVSMPGFIADHLIENAVVQVADAAEAKAAVDRLAAHRPDAIKVVVDELPANTPTFAQTQVAAVVAAAKTHGLRAVAHIGTTEDALVAGRAGVGAWVHGVYKDRVTPEQASELAGFGIPMSPTRVVFWSYARLGRGDYPSTALERQMASASMLTARETRPDDHPLDDSSMAYIELVRKNEAVAQANVLTLANAGVVMMTGSDAQAGVIHGASLHREFALLADAGLSPMQVMQAATINPARFLAATDDPPFGVVAAGKRADLVLVRGDPRADVAALGDIHTVFLAGVPLDRHPLP